MLKSFNCLWQRKKPQEKSFAGNVARGILFVRAICAEIVSVSQIVFEFAGNCSSKKRKLDSVFSLKLTYFFINSASFI